MFGGGFTFWNSTFFDCHSSGPTAEIKLRHSQYDDVNSPPYAECNHGAVIAKSVGRFDNQYYSSQLVVTTGEEMINETIECSLIEESQLDKSHCW